MTAAPARHVDPDDASWGAQAVQRGCGVRQKGGVYWEVPLGRGGAALEDFLLDPPVQLDVEALGLAAVGVLPYDIPDVHTGDAVTHFLDWVGGKFYPAPADFLEEARRFGLSRRVPRTVDFSRLSPRSRLILVHARGWITNAADFVLRSDTGPVRPCPRHNAPHPETVATFDRSRNGRGELVRVPAGMCARLHWENLPDGTRVPLRAPDPEPHPRLVERTLPSFRYRGRTAPEGVQVEHKPAAIASFPLARLVVVKGDGGAHEDTLARIKSAGHTCELVDE